MYKEYKRGTQRIKNDCSIRARHTIEGGTYKAIANDMLGVSGDFRDLANLAKILLNRGYSMSIPTEKDYEGHEGYFLKRGIDITGTCEYVSKRMTVSKFSQLYNKGKYIVITRGHAIPVVNGDYIDTWDSGRNQVQIVFKKI